MLVKDSVISIAENRADRTRLFYQISNIYWKHSFKNQILTGADIHFIASLKISKSISI